MLLKLIAGLCLPVSVMIFFAAEAALWILPLIYVLCFLGLILVAFLILALMSICVDISKPQHEDSKLYRTAMYLYIELILQLLCVTIDTKGMEHIPTGRRFMVVCNHQSETDPAFIHHYFRGSQLAFLSKKEAERMPFVGPFMHMTSCQMINRENDREAMKAIIKCIQMIKEDKVSVCAFPEGGIFEKDKLSHFRSGVFKIAQKANVPIVVCTLKDTSSVLHKLKRLQHIHVRLHLVGVIPEWEHAEMTTVEIADKVYNMMLEDLGEEYRPTAVQNT